MPYIEASAETTKNQPGQRVGERVALSIAGQVLDTLRSCTGPGDPRDIKPKTCISSNTTQPDYAA